MRTSQLKIEGHEIVPKCRLATSFMSRFLGLMGKRSIAPDEALLFPRCNSIHTFFMRFPIDVIFVSKEGRVVDVIEAMGPWRLLLPRRSAKHTIEMRARRSRELGISVGTRLDCDGVWS